MVDSRTIASSSIKLNAHDELGELQSTHALKGGLSKGVAEHPLFHEVRMTIKPKQGADELAQLRDCMHQLDLGLSEMGLSKEFVSQQSTYSTAEPKQLQDAMGEYYQGAPPTTSHIGEPPLEGNKIATEHMVLVPKGENVRISTEYEMLGDMSMYPKTVIESDDAMIVKKQIYHPRWGKTDYTVVLGKKDDTKRVYAAGLTGGAGNIRDSTIGAFELQKAILEKEGMDLTDIMSQRNFIEDIDGPNYHTFNGIRRDYWKGAFTPEHPSLDWPAATGIGQDRNKVTIKFTAERSNKRRVCIDNPTQTRSDGYTDSFQGKQAVTGGAGQTVGTPLDKKGTGAPVQRPAFSRALALIYEDDVVDEKDDGDLIGELWISGTASIGTPNKDGKTIPYAPNGFEPQFVDTSDIVKVIGKEKLAGCGWRLNDDGTQVFAESAIKAQTLDTVNNVARLVCEDTLRANGIEGYVDFEELLRMRDYVKREGDYEEAKGILPKLFGNAASNYVKADVCYAELLFEMGGAVQVRKGLNPKLAA